MLILIFITLNIKYWTHKWKLVTPDVYFTNRYKQTCPPWQKATNRITDIYEPPASQSFILLFPSIWTESLNMDERYKRFLPVSTPNPSFPEPWREFYGQQGGEKKQTAFLKSDTILSSGWRHVQALVSMFSVANSDEPEDSDCWQSGSKLLWSITNEWFGE